MKRFWAPDPPLGTPPRRRTQIGVWYTAWWDAADPFGHWQAIRTPGPPLLGKYTARDPKIIRAQYEAMRACGIDFIIFDDTNTLFVDNSIIDHTIIAWFDFMDALPADKRLGLCLAIGGELNQHSSVEAFSNAADYVARAFAGRRSYLNVAGRPLLLWYIERDVLPDWNHPRFTVKRTYHFLRTGDQAKNGGWGWGAEPYPPDNPECMSLKPGWYGGPPSSPQSRRNGDYYMESWIRILRVRPAYVAIADWNNWSEATAIEDSAGWTDHFGASAPDWYRKITQAYAALLHDNKLIPGFYYRDQNGPSVYRWNGTAREHQGSYPKGDPTILLPDGWLDMLPEQS